MKKKILSLLMAVLMVLSVLPTNVVFAAECDHTFTAANLPATGDDFWLTHSTSDYYVGSKSLVSAELPAGCDVDGWVLTATETTGFCVLCGTFEGEDSKVVTPATGHNYVLDSSSYDPTCLNEGYEKKVCNNNNFTLEVVKNSLTGLYQAKYTMVTCGDIQEKTIPATGHSFTNYVPNHDEDCTTDGTETAICDNGCGISDTRTIPGSALGHNYLEAIVPPTCTAQGFTTHVCSACGDTYTDTYVPATGHSYDAVVTAPTCTVDGYTTYTCSVCGDTYTDDTVPATGHSYDAVVTAPTCIADGYTTYTCSVCGDTYTDDTVPALGHDYELEVVQEPTCGGGGVDGIYKYTCKACGDIYYTYPAAPAHNSASSSVTLPTCTTVGVESGVCDLCHEDYVIVTPALGHDLVLTESQTVSCTQNGYDKYECQRDGCDFEKIVNFVPATGHSFTTYVPDGNATCTEDGTKTATCDNGCGATDTIADPGSATGHSFTNYVSDGNATCTEDGTKTATCDNGCGATDTIVDLGSALGHDYVATVTAPTCTEEGYTTHICSRCGDTYTDTPVPALGHDYDAVVTAPTCTTDGYTTHTCSRCGDVYVDDLVEKLGHNIVLQVDASKKPHCTEAGRNVYVCDRCGEIKNVEYLAPLGHKIKAGTLVEVPADCMTGNQVDYDCDREVVEYDGSTWTCTEHIHTEDDARDDSVVFTANVTEDFAHENSYYVEGYNFDPATDVISTGHDYVWEFVAATCEFDAYWVGNCQRTRDGKTCPESDAIKNSPVIVDCRNTATGHNWALLDDNQSKQPTCTEDGYRHYMCLNDHAHTYTEKLPAMGHNFKLVDTVDATCTEGAYDVYECQNPNCTESYKQYTSAPIAHDYVPVGNVAATCTTEGYEKYECSVCGKEYDKITTPATGHQFVEVDFVDPTCTTKGYTVYECVNAGCDVTKNADFVPATGHNYGKVEVVEPTCTSKGYTVYSCTNPNCGDSYRTAEKDIVPHVIQTMDTVKATCTTDGSVTYACANCDYSFVEVIPATGHNYGKVEVTEATCTTPGFTTYTCTNAGCTDSYTADETDLADHVLTTMDTVKATCTTDGSVTYACANCDYKFVEVIPATGHNYGKLEVVEPTCTSSGYTKHICTNVGCSEYYITDLTDIADHVITTMDTVKATCTEDGSITYACANCDYKFVEVIPATGHNYGKVEVTEATCTTPGFTTYTCTNAGCGDSYISDLTDVKDHVIKSVATVKATCTEDGSITFACANCDYKFVEVIPATGHNYGKVEVVEPTCTAKGYTKHTCTNAGCTDSYTTDETDLAPHVLSKVDVKAPTCTEDGSYNEVCANCDYQLEVVIPATGHNYGKVEVVEPTCTAKGYTKHTCTNAGCTDSYTTDETDMVDHVVTLVSSVAPTCTENGSKVYACSNCAYQLEEVIPATGHSYGDAVRYEATCISKAYTKITCATCGDVVTYETDSAYGGHKTKTVTTPATTSKDGKVDTVCTICNKTIKTVVIPSIKSVSLSYTSAAYTGKALKPAVTVTDRTGAKISSGYYTVSYANYVAIGKATVTVTFKGKYSGTVKRTYKIVPKGVGINSVTTKNGTITMKYGKVTNAHGYQIQYSTSKSFNSYKTVNVTSNNTLTKKISGLKKGKTYYVRVRAYKTVNGAKYYGKWTTFSKVCK